MIRRYYATKDNTITNAFEESLTTRGTGSNMGASDILEIFSIYDQVSNSSGVSSELARILIEFDIPDIKSDRTANLIPASGSVSWYLKMYNAPHTQTVPSQFTLQISAVSSSWEEGYGLDMEFYEDITRNGTGSNWIQARHSASNADDGKWSTAGGDYHAAPTYNQTFQTGLEDLLVDVTPLVEQWISGRSGGGKNNYGFGVKLTNTHESQPKSFFTKKFFGRDTEFHFQKPVLEARWDSSRRDDRGTFYASSSLASAEDNLNTIYLYNNIRGRLRNIPTAPTSASLRAIPTGPNLYSAAVTRESTGIYKADVFLDTTCSVLYDVWYNGSTAYHTGTISVKTFESSVHNPESSYVISMPRLKREYRKSQTHRLDLYTRAKDWSPNIYTTAIATSIPSLIIPSASYQLRRLVDDYIVVPYGTGSTLHTGLSFDVSGNYFDLDTTYLEEGYLYEIQYSFYDEENGWEEQPYRFKFRVVN